MADPLSQKSRNAFQLHQHDEWPFQLSIRHNGKPFAYIQWSTNPAWKTKEDAKKDNAETFILAKALIKAISAE